jgi:hypothetical protein
MATTPSIQPRPLGQLKRNAGAPDANSTRSRQARSISSEQSAKNWLLMFLIPTLPKLAPFYTSPCQQITYCQQSVS